MLNSISDRQAMEMIDLAARENRLYHYNGGSAYIRLNLLSDVLVIIEHTHMSFDTEETTVEITLCDGSTYFKTYAGAQYSYSENMRKNDRTMVDWYDQRAKDSVGVQ